MVEQPIQGHGIRRRIDRLQREPEDRKSTRLNSSHSQISYAVFCLKKKTKNVELFMSHATRKVGKVRRWQLHTSKNKRRGSSAGRRCAAPLQHYRSRPGPLLHSLYV